MPGDVWRRKLRRLVWRRCIAYLRNRFTKFTSRFIRCLYGMGTFLNNLHHLARVWPPRDICEISGWTSFRSRFASTLADL